MVADRGTKEPFDPARRLNAAIKREALSRGLMVYPMGGTIDGRRGDHVLVAPPFIIDQSHIGEIVEKLGDAVDAAVAACRSAPQGALEVDRTDRLPQPAGHPTPQPAVQPPPRPDVSRAETGH